MGDDSLYRDLYEELCATPTIDAHEHLPTEAEALQRPADFYTLFEHYSQADLVSAGATADDLAFWQNRANPVAERWQRFRPLFSAIRTGSYARSALIAMRDVLGIADLGDDTYVAVGEALAAMNKPGLYDALLLQRCNLKACIQCWHYGEDGQPSYFYQLAPSPAIVDVREGAALDRLERHYGHSLHSLDDLLDLTTVLVDKWSNDPVVVGVKSAHAYQRSIAFARRTRHEAEVTFNRIRANEGHELSVNEALPLQDYLFFELVARADAVGLPIVIHTGLQAGNGNRIANANPLGLQALLEEFPRARFDLFHAGMPWVREIAVLAKYFPGVHLNMAWTHIISPVQARAALSEWLDMVPNTKIFGFGGDYGIVQKVYGHLTMARQDIAHVLADKVSEGTYSRAEAGMLIRRLMFDNPNEFYRLGL
ncbi:MAG: amidohydrolase family protein [Anaerolineae bacterium]